MGYGYGRGLCRCSRALAGARTELTKVELALCWIHALNKDVVIEGRLGRLLFEGEGEGER